MGKCSVDSCPNKSDYKCAENSDVTFFTFKKNVDMRRAWTLAIKKNKLDWVPTKHSVVCSEHFEKECIYYTVTGRRKLKPNSVPSLNLTENKKTTETQNSSDNEAASIHNLDESDEDGDFPQPIQLVKEGSTNFCDDVRETVPEENLEIKEEDLSEEIGMEFAEQCIDYTIKYLKQCTETHNRIMFLENLKKDLPTLQRLV